MKKLFLSIALLFVITGCNSQPSTNQAGGQPAWILNPNKGVKGGAIGVAGRTYDQRISTQRKLAITRALDELSLQQGVKVSLSVETSQTVENGSSHSKVKSAGTYKTSSTITAHIEDIYQDKSTGELYVWMVLD